MYCLMGAAIIGVLKEGRCLGRQRRPVVVLGLPHPFGGWTSSTHVTVPAVADCPRAVELVTSSVVLPPAALLPRPYAPVPLLLTSSLHTQLVAQP